MVKFTLPVALSTPTSLGKPCTTSMLCVLLMGKPVPLQVTAPLAETVQPEISWLAALIGTWFAIRSAIASGMLLAQSPATDVQVGVAGVGSDTVVGVLTL